MRPDSSAFAQEAATLAHYLLGVAPTEVESRRYAEAIAASGIEMTARDAQIWKRMMQHPATIPAIDGALALKEPLNPIRHRIFLMLAILEAGPHRTVHFLPQRRRHWFAALVVPGARAVLQAVAGIVLLTWFELRWKSAATSSS